MADFREQGADLPPEKKTCRRDSAAALEIDAKIFGEHLDATNAWERVVTSEESLSGLPESALAAARQSALEKGHEAGWRFTLQAPSLSLS